MNEISHRFQHALDFLIDKGYSVSEAKIAAELGISPQALTMAKRRGPSLEILLGLSDRYPISFWWLRAGEGDMIRNVDRQGALLQKIEQLEKKISELEGKK